MGEKPDQIRQQIEAARNRLGQNLDELEYRVKRTTDWRTHFDTHPWAFLGAAFAGSMLLTMMLSGRK